MRRLALLFAAGTLWLFLAAIPALADGGPHVASVNSGVTSLTADGCAGCHRAHTAQGEALLVEASVEDLCLSCHDATGTGSGVDVVTGVQYIKGSITTPSKAGDPILGYLRDGGFEQAHLGASQTEVMRVGYYRAQDTVSFRMKVPAEAAAETTTSAHLDLDGAGGVVAKNTLWGKGLSNATAPVVSMECASCHNPHGNGQYRILNKLNTSDQFTTSTAVPITSVKAATDRFFTSEAHSLIVGDVVTISGVTGAGGTFNTAAQYIIKSVAGNTFTVAAAPTKTSADITGAVIDVTADGTGGSVVRYASLVDDAPLPAPGDTRNYTIIQTRGTQGTNGSYLLYESDVLAARGGSASFPQGAGISYAAGSGDYFHRTVPWNPALLQANCNTLNPIPSGQCPTGNDAPNGRAATFSSTMAQPHVAYNDQISAWCSTCHTRYYSSTNQNPGGEPSSSADTSKAIASAAGNDILSPANATSNNNFGFAVGDIVSFSAGAPGNQYYVVFYTTTGSGTSQTSTIRVSNALDAAPIAAPASTGTVIRLFPFSSSSWFFPRNGTDTQYKFQHQTTTNRACTTCHVSHGTDAQMLTTGSTTFSADLGYPDGTAGTPGFNSRLLKIDNRGTCQACHDPTGTATAGQQLGNPAAPAIP